MGPAPNELEKYLKKYGTILKNDFLSLRQHFAIPRNNSKLTSKLIIARTKFGTKFGHLWQ